MNRRSLPTGLFFASFLALATSAVACSDVTEGESGSSDVTSAVSVKGEAPMFPGFSYDTGLLPQASPAQASFKASIAGALKVSADGHRAGDKLEGNKGSGKIAIDLHAKLEGQLKVTSTFKNYDGPIPGLDNLDIAAVAEAPFDPYLLGEGEEVEAIANVPETKLPDVPLSGVPGHLELTVKEGTIVKAKLHGSCLSGAEKIATYSGATTTSGTIVLDAKIVLDLPAPLNKAVTLPAISIDLPETTGAIEAKSEASASVTDFTAGSCSAASADGASAGSSTEPGKSDDPSKPADPKQCTALANSAPTVDIEIAAGSLPTGTGGQLMNGTYSLTALRVYEGADASEAGPTGQTIKRTMKITDGKWEATSLYAGATSNSQSTFTTQGNVLTRHIACPAPAETYEDEYTATPTTITVIDRVNSMVFTYGKQ